MIDDLKPYRSYRQTGVPWVPSLPAHWTARRAKTLFSKVSRPVQLGHDVVTCFRDGVVTLRKNRRTTGFTEAIFELGYQGIRRGDLVIHTMDAFAGAVGVSDSDGKGSPVYAVCEPRVGALPAYYAHAIREMARTQWIVALSKGIRQRSTDFRFNVFAVQDVPVPPLDEQAAIVRFLDHANSRIDRFVNATKRLLRLLVEHRQAVIDHAVSGKLTSTEHPFEDRGVFLGLLPQHWPLLRAKYLFHQIVSPVPDRAEQVTCFRDGQVTLRRNRRTTGFTEAIYELGYQGISEGQLVVHSMDAFAGAIGVSDSSGKCSPEYVILGPSISGVHSHYYGLLLRHLALRGLFVALCPSVRERAPRVRFSDFGSFVLPKPPLEEQKAIVDRAHDATAQVDRALKNVREQLGRAQEYRTRLTSDVVTGQLDVRPATASLPAVDPPNTPSDDEDDDIDDNEAA